ncbi:hypothetical protein [Bacteroides sp.]|uniref:hypothetical protein n=1 Tax=Bacteroides sp. TaxID=29523 RepID=UPI002614C8B2|nr:hypothetical protein [Bacteroides sp.]MDD3040463.1 hypothetical protein [Bacteroides sp.]
MFDIYFNLFTYLPSIIADWAIQAIIAIISSILGAYLGYRLAMRAEREKRKVDALEQQNKEKSTAKSIIQYYLYHLIDTQKYILETIKNYKEYAKLCKEKPCEINYVKKLADTSLKKLYEFNLKDLYNSLYVLGNDNEENKEILNLTKIIDFIYLVIKEMESMNIKQGNFTYERQKNVQSNINSIINTLRFLYSVEDTNTHREKVNIFFNIIKENNSTKNYRVLKDNLFIPIIEWIDNKTRNPSTRNEFYERLFPLCQQSINEIDNIGFNVYNLGDDINSYLSSLKNKSKELKELKSKLNLLLEK